MNDASPRNTNDHVVTDEQETPSLRLRQILRTYCHQLEPSGVTDLRRSIAAGRYNWLHDELADALTTPAPGHAWWTESVGEPQHAAAVPARLGIEAAQHYLWHTLFPTEPVPG